jgi:uncharacterized membrane protein YkoI
MPQRAASNASANLWGIPELPIRRLDKMRKTVLAAVAVTGLAMTGVTGVALAAGDDDGRRVPSAVAVAAPSASATADDNGGQRQGFGEDSTPDPTAAGSIDRTRAWAIAQLRAGGGKVTKTELEREHGRLVWKIEVFVGTVEYDVRIDANTGEVVRLKWRDRASDDRGEVRNDRDDDRGRGGGSDDGPDDDNGGDRGGHGSDDGPGDDHGGDRDRGDDD